MLEHVGGILAHFSLLAAFFDMVQELLQKNPAGIPFLFFVSTMQRGGTCEAHPPPPEGQASRVEH